MKRLLLKCQLQEVTGVFPTPRGYRIKSQAWVYTHLYSFLSQVVKSVKLTDYTQNNIMRMINLASALIKCVSGKVMTCDETHTQISREREDMEFITFGFRNHGLLWGPRRPAWGPVTWSTTLCAVCLSLSGFA